MLSYQLISSFTFLWTKHVLGFHSDLYSFSQPNNKNPDVEMAALWRSTSVEEEPENGGKSND